MENISKILYITAGVFLLMTLVWNLYSKLPRMFWDINIDRPGFKVYIPIISSIVLSAALALLFNFFKG